MHKNVHKKRINGDVHEHRYHCPVDHDINQALLDWIPTLDASLIESEKESYQAAIENGDDPATIITKHLTATQKAKRVVDIEKYKILEDAPLL